MRIRDRFRSGRRLDEILEQELLAPTSDTGREPGVEMLEPGSEIAFEVLLDEDGRAVLPAFTSEGALARWKPQGSPYVALRGSVLVEMLAASEWDRIVVDIADRRAFAITREAARACIGGVALTVPVDATYLIGQPAREPPEDLVAALCSACHRESAIAEAYLYQFQILEREEPPQLTVGLQLQPSAPAAEFERVAKSIGREVDAQRWGYDSLDYHLLVGDMLDTVRSSDPVLIYAHLNP